MSVRSVPRDPRTAPAIVQADEAHVDVLPNPVAAEDPTRGRCEADRAIAKENVVVLKAQRPVRGEAELQTGPDRTTPASLPRRSQQRARAGRTCSSVDVVLVANDGGAALHVEQHVVPGVTDLTGDEAEGVDAGTVAITRHQSGTREQGAHIVAPEVGPVALAFETEHPIGGLPAIADLATDGAPRRIVTAFADQNAGRGRDEVPARVARATAAVDADVEAAPIVDRGNRRRGGLGVGTRGHIRRARGSRQAHSHCTDRTNQKLIHCQSPQLRPLLSSPKRLIRREGPYELS